jgi:hypothetical protein
MSLAYLPLSGHLLLVTVRPILPTLVVLSLSLSLWLLLLLLLLWMLLASPDSLTH